MRIKSVDICKGLAILLMVIFHFEPGFVIPFFEKMRILVYSFHMPLFIFLSGFLFGQAKRKIILKKYLKDKALRLGIPYFSVTLIILGIKFFAGRIFRLIVVQLRFLLA
jgi:fucose 4-O-acetylase-like acetyltransferase